MENVLILSFYGLMVYYTLRQFLRFLLVEFQKNDSDSVLVLVFHPLSLISCNLIDCYLQRVDTSSFLEGVISSNGSILSRSRLESASQLYSLDPNLSIGLLPSYLGSVMPSEVRYATNPASRDFILNYYQYTFVCTDHFFQHRIHSLFVQNNSFS